MTKLEKDFETAKVCVHFILCITLFTNSLPFFIPSLSPSFPPPLTLSLPILTPSLSLSHANPLQEAFMEVVQYFGENAKSAQPNTVFPVLHRFVGGFRVRPLLLGTPSFTVPSFSFHLILLLCPPSLAESRLREPC